MKKRNLLIDLKIAMNNGYCGIANENRLVFKMLAQANLANVSGLLVSDNPATVFTNYQSVPGRQAAIEQANRFFHEAFHHELLFKNKLLSKLKLAKWFALKKNNFHLHHADAVFQDVIWRNVFDKTLTSIDRNLILKNEFYYSDLTSLHLRASSYLNRKVTLNTTNYDVALFLEPTTVSVSPNTKKIVRYHDAIPITEPDFAGSIFSHRTINMLHACARDSYFVCNSEPTRQTLLALKPELENKTFTIPACISSHYKKVKNVKLLQQIMSTRLSTQLIHPERLAQIQHQIYCEETPNYIFNLATLDPKKNQMNLIRAWEKLNYQFQRQTKLVIAANRGWLSHEIEMLMRPHIERGDIIHLDNLATDEVAYLYSHAQAFIFPSYMEGFGLPPIEAMQCECPTIVSDIPTHRWVMGEASLYCDPYDSNSLADAMAKLIHLPGATELRADLVRKGLEQVKRYSEDTLREQWVDLVNRI